ncbi:MAG: sulfatase, partial [Phototrophicaceae bacterium]
ADAARWASPDEPPLADWQRHIVETYYDAEIAAQDEHLGRLLRHLEPTGALDNTLVLVLADHGEGHGDHGFFGHSFVVYQELVHVPLMIHDPRQPGAQRIADSASTRRIFHTVLDAAGLTPPLDEADPNADVRGLSLLPSSRNGHSAEPDLAFAEAVPPHTFLRLIRSRQPQLIEQLRLDQTRRAVYRGAQKLATVGDSVEALFDVQTDPQETQNLAGERADLSGDLQRELDAFVLAAEYYRMDGPAYHTVSDGVVANLRALGYFE